MRSIKLKIINNIDLTTELKLYNSIVRYSFNRFQDHLEQKQIRSLINTKFKGNSWFIQSAIKQGYALFKRFKNKKIVFGGRSNLNNYLKHLLTKEQYQQNKLKPIVIQGQKLHKGNRLFNFDLLNNKIELKLSKLDHRIIQFKQPNKNYYKELIKLQQKIDSGQITLTVALNNQNIILTYDESLLTNNKFNNLKSNRILGIDLNPNNISLSVLQFNQNNQFKVLFKQVFDLFNLNNKAINSNKRKHQLIQICYQINKLINYWKCSKLAIENLNIKAKNHHKGKWFNRIVNNCWNRSLVINKLKMLANINGYQLIQINAVYSSFIGNILYGDINTPDPIAASIQIARRAFNKFKKNCFYPKFNIDRLDEQWKQTLTGINDWITAFDKVKESKMSYRFLLQDYIQNAVFRKEYSKLYINKLIYI